MNVDLQTWMNVNTDTTTAIFGEFEDQLKFVRDRLSPIVNDEGKVCVISVHMSKSIKLPVYCIESGDKVLRIILRNNFYDWKVSVCSVKPIELDLSDLIDPNEVISNCYCEGFPNDLTYGSYNQNHNKFTVELNGTYRVFLLVWEITKALNIITKYRKQG